MSPAKRVRTTDDAFLDRAERDAVERDLKTIAAWLAEDLDDVIAKQTNYLGSGRPRGKNRRKASDEAPWPMDLDASDTSWDLVNTLQAWVDTVALQRHYPHPGRLRAKEAAIWLGRKIIALSLCEDADQAADEIHNAVVRARRTVDRPRFRSYQGQCEVCGAELWAHREDEEITCRECEKVVDKQAHDRQIVSEMEGRAFTADELVNVVEDRFGVGIKAKTVHDLAYRKTNPIRVLGQTYEGRKLYRAGDVFDALRRRGVIVDTLVGS